MGQHGELGNQLRTLYGILHDGAVETRVGELWIRQCECREPLVSNNSEAFLIAPELQLEISFQFFTCNAQLSGRSTPFRPTAAYPTTPSITLPCLLRTSNALEI